MNCNLTKQCGFVMTKCFFFGVCVCVIHQSTPLYVCHHLLDEKIHILFSAFATFFTGWGWLSRHPQEEGYHQNHGSSYIAQLVTQCLVITPLCTVIIVTAANSTSFYTETVNECGCYPCSITIPQVGRITNSQRSNLF